MIVGANLSGSSVFLGQAMCRSGSGFGLADASDPSRFPAIGLVGAKQNQSLTVGLMPDGALTLYNWTQVTGSTMLTPGATYFLDVNGKLSTTASHGSGGSQRIGVAVSATTLAIFISGNIGTPFTVPGSTVAGTVLTNDGTGNAIWAAASGGGGGGGAVVSASGSQEITPGADSVAITLSLASAPTMVFINITCPTNGSLIYGLVDQSSLSSSGFNVLLTGAPDGAGYFVNYVVFGGVVSLLANGSHALTIGADSLSVPLALSTSPTMALVNVSCPANGLLLFARVEQGSLSSSGFNVLLSGQPDASGYFLNYIVL